MAPRTSRPVRRPRRHPRVRALGVVALGALAVASLTGCQPTNRLGNGAVLAPGAAISSPDNAFRLEMQTDGNLVLRRTGGAALWHARTAGNAGAKLTMRTSGVLALTSKSGAILWSTPTHGVKGAVVDVQADGNLVVKGSAGEPWWASGTSTVSAARAPLTQRRTSSHQATLIKIYEGYVGATPYHDRNGNCTVGYGHLIRLGNCTAADRAKTWNVEALFTADLKDHEDRIKRTLGAVPVSQREFDALLGFAYHRGSISASSAPKLYAAMRATPPNYAAAAAALREMGDAAGSTGICNRRHDEAQLFEGGRYDRSSHC